MITVERSTYEYGERPGHYRITSRNHAPPKIADGRIYLYVCAFEKKAKVGVTTDVLMRIATHEKVAGAFDHGYLILMDRAAAFQQEAMIARALGKPGPRRWSEWFPLESLPVATMLMWTPEFERAYWWMQNQFRDFEQLGFDCRFTATSEWPKPPAAARAEAGEAA